LPFRILSAEQMKDFPAVPATKLIAKITGRP